MSTRTAVNFMYDESKDFVKQYCNLLQQYCNTNPNVLVLSTLSPITDKKQNKKILKRLNKNRRYHVDFNHNQFTFFKLIDNDDDGEEEAILKAMKHYKSCSCRCSLHFIVKQWSHNDTTELIQRLGKDWYYVGEDMDEQGGLLHIYTNGHIHELEINIEH